MKIAVYDTYASSADGTTIHFDVLLPSSENKDKALTYATHFLKDIGKSTSTITLDRCDFCHTEMANPQLRKKIETEGYVILKMEGCPS